MPKYKKKCLSLILMFIITFITMLFNVKVVSANTNIWGQGNLGSSEYGEVVNDQTEISGDYSFIARWIDGKTTVSTFGGKWTEGYHIYGGTTGAVGFLPTSDNQKGTFGVIYHNVGMFNGHTIDLKITIIDWEKNTKKYGYIWYTKGAIAHLQQSYIYVKQNWEFIDSETKEPVNLSGYMTVTDLDYGQGITFDKDTVKKLDKIYVTKDSIVNVKKESDGGLTIYDPFMVNSLPDDKWAQFTFLYKNTSSIVFDWNLKTRPNSIAEPDLSGNVVGEFFGYTGKKFARTATVAPEKYIKGDNLKDLKTESKLDSLTGKLTYEVYHKVPDEWVDFYYNSYELKDIVPEGLTIISSKIYDQEGNDVSSYFDNNSTGNVILYKAKSSILKESKFYNKDYRIEIITTPSSKEALDKLLTSDNVVYFKNKADVIVDGKSKTSNKVSSSLYRRKITVNHIDEKTGKLLKQTVEYKYDGEKYKYEPAKDLVDSEGNSYKVSTSFDDYSGTVNGKDIILNIPYHVPSLEVNIDKILIGTEKADKGLPVILTFSKKSEYSGELKNLVYRVRIVDTDNNKVVYDKEYNLDDYQKKQQITLNTDYLNKGQKVNYSIDILISKNPDNNKFQTETKNVLTYGFTASEKILSNADVVNGKIDYSAPIATEKYRLIPAVKEYFERIFFNFNNKVDTKSGYGVDLGLSLTTTTNEPYIEDLPVSSQAKISTISLTAYPEEKLVDSYINKAYSLSLGKYKIPMVRVGNLLENNVKDSAGNIVESVTKNVTMPHVNVERKTGNLFTDDQINNSWLIKYDLVDGQHYFYTPIWLDVGKYNVDFKSNVVGRNYISLNLTKQINIYAQMYATIDSKTKEKDELLLEPVYPESENPKGWTKSELDWLKK